MPNTSYPSRWIAGFRFLLGLVAVVLCTIPASRLEAGFNGTDVFIPAVARVDGLGNSHFYSTLWMTNLTASNANVTIQLLLQGQANPGPINRSTTIPSGVTQRIEDVVGAFFGINGKGAALRIQSDQDLFVSSRTYNLPTGSTLKDSNGLFFSGIPSSLAIGLGETSTLQGVSNGNIEDFRYNFGFVETTGQPVTLNVTVRDQNGAQIGSVQQYSLGGFEARQESGFSSFPVAVETQNARIDITVASGFGKVITYGTLVAGTNENPGSNDSIGFEMSFKNLLAGVTSLNGLAGAVTIQAGNSSTSVTTNGSNIVIAGVKGDTGAQGQKGDTGATGATGTQGPAGPSGLFVAIFDGTTGAAPRIIAQKPAGWIAVATRVSPGGYNIFPASGVFTGIPACVCSAGGAAAYICMVNAATATVIPVAVMNGAGSGLGFLDDSSIKVMCTNMP